jgi:site-specific DNA-methyltransferase (adenine-specific)
VKTISKNKYELYNDDCLSKFKDIPDKSVDLVLIDPPYNIGKDVWDKWPTVEAYVEFMGQVFLECQRVLKDNGSFYFFHNDFLQIVELQNWINKNTDFVFKQLLVWDKFNGVKPGTKGRNCTFSNQRNWAKCAEYCLYYTFQDETDVNNFKSLRDYFKNLQIYLHLNKKQIIEKIGQRADHCFRHSSSQWDLPTKETYQMLIDIFNIDKYEGFKTYEELRQEYEELKCTFNNQGLPSVLQHAPVLKNGHITPKPVDLLQHIIKTSSNEGDTVLDCFMGSGSTGVACMNTNRKFIGIEIDEKYFNIAKERIEDAETS